MNLLKDGIANHAVERTPQTRKLTIDGLTKAYPVFRIRLDWLFYNDQNDRIATWISKYRAQHQGKTPDSADREAYNKIIEEFIVESNQDKMRATQANIELFDQREAGVVLNDGRIIDGNRRFTCLRRLAEKNDRFRYFEAVILDRDIENSAKQIKMLELSIQHGEESKVDYNPIDRLVGIYHDVVETTLLSEEEYAKSTNETLPDIRRRMELSKLMVEFLDFINAHDQFYIARDLQIYYPLDELLKLLKKAHTEDEKEDIKHTVFHNILMQPASDMTRFVRNFKSIIGSQYQDEFLEEQKELAEQTLDLLPAEGGITSAVIRDQIRNNEEIESAMSRSMDKTMTKVKKNETRNRPIQLAEKAATFLEGIDSNILQKMNDTELQRFARQLDQLENVIRELRENL